MLFNYRYKKKKLRNLKCTSTLLQGKKLRFLRHVFLYKKYGKNTTEFMHHFGLIHSKTRTEIITLKIVHNAESSSNLHFSHLWPILEWCLFGLTFGRTGWLFGPIPPKLLNILIYFSLKWRESYSLMVFISFCNSTKIEPSQKMLQPFIIRRSRNYSIKKETTHDLL